MSIFQPSSLAARRTFWPFLPMASESCESSTITSMCFSSGSRIDDAADLGRAQRVRGEDHRIVGILDDVDLLAAQLADDRLHAHALHAHAGAHAIHVAVAALHGDLGALAGFARAAFDDHRVVVDLRHFLLEQAHHQLRRGARNHHARALARTCPPAGSRSGRGRPRCSFPGATVPSWAAGLRSCPGPACRSGPSTRLMVQFTSSPMRPEYSWKTVSRSASRTFCKITCLAVWAEMRPSASVVFGNANFAADFGLGIDAPRLAQASSRCTGSSTASHHFLHARRVGSRRSWRSMSAT